MVLANCPDDDVLRSLSTGTLPSEAVDRIVEHVSECRHCETALERFDADTDPFLQSLQHSQQGHAAVACATGVPAGVSASLRQIGVSDERGSSSSVTTDPGRRYARLLAEGPVIIDRFQLLGELGTGSFGYVFQARDTGLDRNVALMENWPMTCGDTSMASLCRPDRSAVWNVSGGGVRGIHLPRCCSSH